MEHRDWVILKKVLGEMDFAISALDGIDLETFLSDEILERAIAMTVINIGELVKNLTDELRANNPQVPWKAMAGFRDIAAHQYQTLKMEDVYLTVRMDFPDLQSKINSMV